MKKTGRYPQESEKTAPCGLDPKSKARRRLIQTLAVGGGIASSKLVPQRWAAPMVETAVLPAHASGSTCTLGNNSAAVFTVQIQPAGPVVGTELLAQQIVDTIVPQAEAGDGDDSQPLELTGCFWIEFLCSSNSGTLYASAVDTNADGIEQTTLSMPFVDGICAQLEEIPEIYFKVTLGEGGSSAILNIGYGPEGCSDLEELSLVPNYNCQPFVFDDTPEGP